MASLQDKKIKDTFQGLLKTEDNEVLTGASKELTDGEGNGSGLHLNTAGDFKADGTLEFGNLKDTTEDITITKFVDEADGIANNDNDTSIPTTAAVKDYVDTNVTAQDLDFAGDSGTGAVDLDSQSLNLVGTNGVVTSASGQTITIDTSSLDSRLTTAEADIDTNTADIATEEAARIAADNTLQSNIDSEESARISADTTLQSNIDSEAATRAAADSAEAATRLANDNTLQDNIDAEEALRISADNTLQANINTEATTRATADTTLQNNIDTEAATRLANDTTLQSNIDTEESARIAADNTLQSNIDSEAATRLSNDTTLQGNIDAEETARIAADSNLQSQVTSNDGDITALDGRLTTAETNISSNDTDISNLQSDKQDISEKGQANGYAPLDSGAKISEAYLPDSIVGQLEYQGTWDASTDTPTLPAASTVKGHYYVTSVGGTYETIDYAIGDWVISNGTSWEKVDNTDAVTTVFGRLGAIVANESDYSSFYPLISDLTTETNARISADTDLANDISTEASTRASADSTLQGNIDTEEAARIAADNTLQSNIDSEETARIAGDANLQSQIDTINLDNVDGSGTANYVPKWTDGDTIGNSVIYDDGTNIGIGTTSPDRALHVFDRVAFSNSDDTGSLLFVPSNTTNGIFSRASNTSSTAVDLQFYAGSNPTMRIDSSGNVGIGTSSPSTALTVAGTVTSASGIFSDVSTIETKTNGADAALNFTTETGNTYRIGTKDSDNTFRIAKSDSSLNTNPYLTINSSGNVGINTTSPAGKLSVLLGETNLSTASAAATTGYPLSIRFTGTASDNNLIRHESSANPTGYYTLMGTRYDNNKSFVINNKGSEIITYSDITSNGLGLSGGAGNLIRFTTNSLERMRIDSSGNVRINSESAAASGTKNLQFWRDGNERGRLAFDFSQSLLQFQADGYMTFLTAGENERMRIDSAGNVGIGTSSPFNNAKLQIKTATNVNLGFQTGTTLTTGFKINAYNDLANANIPLELNASTVLLKTLETERMRITSAGAIHLSQGTGNSYVGTNAGNLGTSTGVNNSAFGQGALFSNTTGNSNVANGINALYFNTTGANNVANGQQALNSNTTGGNNVANGLQALYYNTTASSNTATGYRALYLNTTGFNNTAIGREALYNNTTGFNNTANGAATLYSNTTGTENTANGLSALFYNTTGASNLANGFQSLFANTTGGSNVAVGHSALRNNTTGDSNTANGLKALFSNTTGNENTATGKGSLFSNTTGRYNAANGFDASLLNTTGNNNTSMGAFALRNNTTGNNNVANGGLALYSNTTGNNSVANGFGALYNNTTGTINTAIGSSALEFNTTGSGNIAIGSLTSAGAYDPAFNITTQNNRISMGSRAVTNADIKVAWTVVSDARDKTNFGEVPHGLDFVSKLEPISYKFKESRDSDVSVGDVKYGFKAQDILALEGDNNVIIDAKDEDTLRYNESSLIPVLVNAIKELKAEIELLKNK